MRPTTSGSGRSQCRHGPGGRWCQWRSRARRWQDKNFWNQSQRWQNRWPKQVRQAQAVHLVLQYGVQWVTGEWQCEVAEGWY